MEVRMRAGVLVVALLALAGGAWWFVARGGGDAEEGPGEAPAASAYRVVPPDPTWGVIEGTVRLARDLGVPAVRRKPGCEDDVSWTERASDIIAYRPESLTLQDCVVFLRRIDAGKDWPAAMRAEPRTLTLTLRDGMLAPHVAWVRTGTGLRFVSAMPRSEANPQGWFSRWKDGAPRALAFNLMLSPLGSVLPNDDTRLDRAGLTTITGNVCFRWIRAHVLAFDHPYVFGPTGHDGVYALEGVPSGEHEVTCWHGPLTLVVRPGRQPDAPLEYDYGPAVQTTQTVKVEPGGRARLDFVLDAPR